MDLEMSNTCSKVFVAQIPHRLNRDTGELEPLDISAARDFGEVRVLLTPGANPFTSMPSIVDDLHKGLEEINERDYLVLIGNPAVLGVMTAIAAQYTSGKLNVLQWHGKQRKYNPIAINVN